MTALPREIKSFKPLYNLLTGSISAKLLRAGLAIKIFDALDSSRTADSVAAKIHSHPKNTRIFLDALTTIGLIEKKQGFYQNLPETSSFLISTSDLYLEPLFKVVQEICIDPLDDLTELVRQGSCPSGLRPDLSSETLWADHARASASWVLGNMGCRIAEIVSKLPGFSEFENLLDLGGGHGIFALYIVQAHETMKGVVFDKPAVSQVAMEFIETYDMSGRVSVTGGDYRIDEIGEGYDLIWASSTLSLGGQNLDAIVDKIHSALKPDGYFISLHDGMTHEQTRPDTILGSLASLLSSGEDFRMKQGEIANAMLHCGFRTVQSQTIDTPMGILDLDISRK